MKKEPVVRVIKRSRSHKTTHTAISVLTDLQKLFGEAMLWLKHLAQKFNPTEKLVLMVLVAVVVVSSVPLIYAEVGDTEVQAAPGGAHIEGLVGKSRYLNPLLAGTNPVDRDISSLIYSGLTKVGPGREILPDLATSWDVLDNGKAYIFHLQTNAKWHDGEKFSADDVLFTFNILQNNDYSGVLKSSFSGMLVEKLDDATIKFTLPTASAFFLTDINVGIIPEHIYRSIPVKELASRYDTSQIIGTGPFMYQPSTATAVNLAQFKDYYGAKPYLDSVVFYFFDTSESLYAAFRNRQVSAAGFSEPIVQDLGPNDGQYNFVLPQYKGIFFNQLGSNGLLKDVRLRQALAYATNKQQIIDEVEHGYASRVDSPILVGFWGHNPDMKKYDFDIAKSANLLKQSGWSDSNKDGILEKDNGQTRLSLKIAFRDDDKSRKTAELIQKTWRSIGVEAILEPSDAATLIKDVIRPRNYEILLFGQDLGSDSDPYVYWHSSQIKDPGLALAVEVDKDIDNNLEQARTAASVTKAVPYYIKFQAAFSDLVPAILLYQPKYTYLVDKKVKGLTDKINLSSTTDRFITINQWYVKTKRG